MPSHRSRSPPRAAARARGRRPPARRPCSRHRASRPASPAAPARRAWCGSSRGSCPGSGKRRSRSRRDESRRVQYRFEKIGRRGLAARPGHADHLHRARWIPVKPGRREREREPRVGDAKIRREAGAWRLLPITSAAPCCWACPMKRCPSWAEPRTATKTVPAATWRESEVTPVTPFARSSAESPVSQISGRSSEMVFFTGDILRFRERQPHGVAFRRFPCPLPETESVRDRCP